MAVFNILFGLAMVASVLGADPDPFFKTDYTYSSITKMFYKVMKPKAAWFDAVIACYNDGAILASPWSAVEYQELVQQAGLGVQIWLGANDIIEEGRFVDMEGKSGNQLFINWQEPNGPSKLLDDCLQVQKNGKTIVQNCRATSSFVCTKRINKPAENVPCSCKNDGPSFRNDYRLVRPSNIFYKKHAANTWRNAVLTCASEGAELAQPLNIAENNELVTQMGDVAINWIGIHDLVKEMRFDGLNGDSGRNLFIRFAANQPDNRQIENCVHIFADGLANDLSCDSRASYVCTKRYVAPAVDPECACCCASKKVTFTHHKTSLTWADAISACMAINATLATPINLEENNAITKIVNNPNTPVWIGIHDIFIEEKFMRLDGDNRVNFVNWDGGEPNNKFNIEDCVVVRNGTMNDVPCTGTYEYVCSKRNSPCK